MSQESVFKFSISIKAEPEKVWDALINPEMTKQYMYGCVVISDWQPGSSLSWRGGDANGVEYVKGHVINFEPNKLMTLTSFDPNSDLEDIPENYLTADYALSYENGETTLHISQYDFATAGDGAKRFAEAAGAWEMSLGSLKTILES